MEGKVVAFDTQKSSGKILGDDLKVYNFHERNERIELNMKVIFSIRQIKRKKVAHQIMRVL